MQSAQPDKFSRDLINFYEQKSTDIMKSTQTTLSTSIHQTVMKCLNVATTIYNEGKKEKPTESSMLNEEELKQSLINGSEAVLKLISDGKHEEMNKMFQSPLPEVNDALFFNLYQEGNHNTYKK